MGNVFGLIGKAVSFVGKNSKMSKYGKLLGSNRNALKAFSKVTGDNEKVITVLKDGKLVRTKKVVTGGNITKYSVFDAKSNLLSQTLQNRTPVGFSRASGNQHAAQVRTIRLEYNKMGQRTHVSDRTFTPSTTELKADIMARVDGNVSKTYMNTQNGSFYKINCVE